MKQFISRQRVPYAQMHNGLVLTVSEFVAVLNQTLEYAYPDITITGELTNFRVSKNRWVYFDLKDGQASVKCFATIYQLSSPLEDGMMVAVRGTPRLHPLYGFSVTAQMIAPLGEGAIKKAAQLLEAKLRGEGLFDETRKRRLPYPPQHIGLIASGESAAYRDFIKILDARWGGLRITHIDVQVQGEIAPHQIVSAVRQLNQLAVPPDVIVITRGGGSAEDLQAFSTEQVTRAVAASRIPTIVAIGHEVDISLAELAADQRASTPSNAAELLVPDRQAALRHLSSYRKQLHEGAIGSLRQGRQTLVSRGAMLLQSVQQVFVQATDRLGLHRQLLEAYNPQAALSRGYAVVRSEGDYIRSGGALRPEQAIEIELQDAHATAVIKSVTMKGK